MGDFKIPNLFKSWFFSAPGLRAWGGGGSPVSWFSSPERLPPHITAVSDLPTLCQGKKRIGRKGNSFACLALCPLVSVTSGYADYPDMTLSLLFFFLRGAPSAPTYPDCSYLLQTTLLWLCQLWINSLGPGLLVVLFPIGEWGGKVPFQMITSPRFWWILLCSLGHTTVCLL